MDVDFFVFPSGPQLSHLIHVSVCVCVSGGAYSCMHLCVASWQNVGHGGSAAAWHALTWKWPKSHSLWYHSVCVHPLSLSLSPSVSPWMSLGPFIFILCAFFIVIIKVFVYTPEPFPCLFHFTPLTCIFIYSPILFSQTSLFLIHYFIFVICLLALSPCLM